VPDAAIAARVQHSMKRAGDGTVVWRHDAEGIAAARLAATPQQLVDLWPHVDSLRLPTLLLHGARSDFLTAETAQAMVQRNPAIRLVDVPDASHYAHDDNLAGFEAALHAYLADTALAGWAGRRAR
jgi:pimeloyl-ACP methyl ester carboxylesterase